ncbi:MAG TPA: hypothetical protein ENH72_09670 [Pseudomonas sabulinigri]|uniref:Uncharacterized protein n=1 Tax=marine sediment metagenome TaxID=412755 RepID=A0A0F9VIY7_9ZZZZ|nr:hypothetical protein [Halopseudomonas sabulinigri]HEC50819.1 hypothetical protein [Halopseudomonas sabulinigri]
MSRVILETRRQVVSAIIRAYPGGREGAAGLLGLSLKQFDNHAYENNGHRPLDDSQVAAMEAVTNTTFLVDYICQQFSGYFVHMPAAELLDNIDLHQRSLRTSSRSGKVDQYIAKALEDGEISEREKLEILALHAKHLSERHGQVLATINLHTRKED